MRAEGRRGGDGRGPAGLPEEPAQPARCAGSAARVHGEVSRDARGQLPDRSHNAAREPPGEGLRAQPRGPPASTEDGGHSVLPAPETGRERSSLRQTVRTTHRKGCPGRHTLEHPAPSLSCSGRTLLPPGSTGGPGRGGEGAGAVLSRAGLRASSNTLSDTPRPQFLPIRKCISAFSLFSPLPVFSLQTVMLSPDTSNFPRLSFGPA